MKKMNKWNRVEFGLTGLGFVTAVGGMGIAYFTDNYSMHNKSFGLGLIIMSSSLVIKGIECIVTNG